METTNNNKLDLIAKCGLYCGNCRTYKKGKCPGCVENSKATWCKARACCIENNHVTCADCATTTPRDCKKFSNFISDIFSFIFKSDRPASIKFIKENGRNAYVDLMIDENRMSIKK